MAVPIKRYKLTKLQKGQIVDYLYGSISRDELADCLKMTSQAVYTVCTSILRHMTTNGIASVEEALNDY